MRVPKKRVLQRLVVMATSARSLSSAPRPAVKSRKPAAAAANDAKKPFSSCHYCRQKRADIVTCTVHKEGHRWCGSCVRNHLGLDI
eukprot:COSAG01_NODE_59044_length_302_cov_1.024631_1_plen_85_part_01